MIFAETTLADFVSVLLASLIAIVIAATAVIVAYLRRLQKQVEATDTTALTAHVARNVNAVSQKVSAVYETVNGNGLTGSIRRVESAVERIEENQKSHEAKDDDRFGRIEKYMGMPPP